MQGSSLSFQLSKQPRHRSDWVDALAVQSKPSLVFLFVVVVDELVLYIHGQQLRSCRDGQLSYPHSSWASLPEAGYQYLASILSPLTDKCSS